MLITEVTGLNPWVVGRFCSLELVLGLVVLLVFLRAVVGCWLLGGCWVVVGWLLGGCWLLVASCWLLVCCSDCSLGTPVLPFLTPFWLGGTPPTKIDKTGKKSGTNFF